MTEFILITFYNTIENEQYLHFCQWNGNEEALSTLQWLTHYIPDDILISDTPSLTYTINIHVKFSEESVNQFLRIDSNTTFNTSYPLITKCYGTLSLPAQLSPSAISDISEFRRFEYIPDLIHHLFYPFKFPSYWERKETNKIRPLPPRAVVSPINL